jgi:hypothetical protein
MYSITARLAASAALAAICAAGAAAACPTPCNAIVINDQIQLGDVFSNLVITAATPHSLTGVSAASGSSVAAGAVETGLIFDSRQELAANVAAGAVIEADSVAGQALSMVAANGNAAITSACCGTNASVARQTSAAGTTVSGASSLTIRGRTGSAVSTVQTSGNSAEFSGRMGDLEAHAEQTNRATISAESRVQVCCHASMIGSTALAVANQTRVDGYATTQSLSAVQESSGPLVIASSNITAKSAGSAAGAAAAAGNSFEANNAWGYSRGEVYQRNAAYVQSESYVTLDNWSDSATSLANSLGNSAMLSTLGSDAYLEARQINEDGVVANAFLVGTGGVGSSAVVQSAAIGNAITGQVCASCGAGVTMNGVSEQTNWGAVRSNTTISVGGAGSVFGSATAVGNSAAYHAIRR